MGAFPDADPSLLSLKSLHIAQNYRVFPWGAISRGGSQRIHDIPLPYLPGRTGYSLTKSGTTVTKTAGTDFSADDVGNYIVYDDGKHERIETYIGTTQVTVAKTDAHAASTSAYVRGPKNARIFHEKKRIHILFIDTRLFYCTSVIVDGWSEIHKSGIGSAPVSEESTLEPFDDYATLKNSGGLYKIDLNSFLYWRMNSEVPTTRISDVEETVSLPWGKNYLYTMGRLAGTASQTRTRYDSGVEIQHESGTVETDESGKDYGSVFSGNRTGPGDTTYGKLLCGALVSPYDVPSGWNVISDGQFNIPIDGVTQNIKCDFTGATSMSEVGERIQSALRDFHATIECIYHSPRFWITNPEEGGTLGPTTSGSGGTDISGAMKGGVGDYWLLSQPQFTDPLIIGDLEIPIDQETSMYESLWNVYCIYSSLHIGKYGKDQLTGEINNDQLFLWQRDIPAAKAFVASLTTFVITAAEGVFEPCDVGCVVRFQNGVEATISLYVDSTHVNSNYSGTVTSQAAAIGGDGSVGKAIRVITASQAGQTVTRSGGDVFSANDVGRIIFWPDGFESHVIGYTDPNTVTVKESATIASTGCCIEPKTRKYCDVIRDDVHGDDDNLRTRIGVYALQNRFFTPMPGGCLGKNTANLLTVTSPGLNILYYCAADVNYRHHAGYHYASKQREIFQDGIYSVTECKDTLSIKCANSTRAVPINQFGAYVIEKAGTAIITLTGQQMIDERVGVKHHGGVCVIERSLQIVITGEPAIRIFDGSQYGENLADQRIQKILEACQAAYAMAYSPIDGVHIWLLED